MVLNNGLIIFGNIIIVIVLILFILMGLIPVNSQKIKIRVFLKDIVNKIKSGFAIPVKKYKTMGKGGKIYYGLATLVLLLIFSFLFYSLNVERLNTYFSLELLIYTLIGVLIVMGVFYVYAMLIEIFIGDFILEYINNINDDIGRIAFVSLYIPYLVLACLSINKSNVSIMVYVCLIAVVFSHFFVYKGLYLIINKPNYLSVKTHKLKPYSKYVGMIVWLLILMLNLFSAVFLVTRIDSNAFVDNNNQVKDNNGVNDPIELIYFTITSLITNGFGDITPNSPWGKGVMALIFISGLYYLVIFIGTVLTASISNKDALYNFVNRRVNLIVKNCDKLLSNIEKEAHVDIPRNEISEGKALYRALSKIKIDNKSLVLDKHDCDGNWIKYLNYSKEDCLKNIRDLLIFSQQLDPKMLDILLEIEDSDYFELLDNECIEIASNSDLGFLTGKLEKYISHIDELEKYRKTNLDEHKSEKRRLPIEENLDKVNKTKRDKRGNGIQG